MCCVLHVHGVHIHAAVSKKHSALIMYLISVRTRLYKVLRCTTEAANSTHIALPPISLLSSKH